MRYLTRLLVAASAAGFVALLPIAAQAATNVNLKFGGAEYAVGHTSCGDTGSFAGAATANGHGALFNTTICHSPLGNTNGATASILAGGSFVLYMRSRTLVGQYATGGVGPGAITKLGFLCREAFPISATLGPASAVPSGMTNIKGGGAGGVLTHYGVLSPDGAHCVALAASISGQGQLTY